MLNQTSKDWELIIVDDASEDNTSLILNKYADNPQIKILFQKVNQGANVCRNLGISKATGKFLMFLDADDLLAIDCIERRLRVLSEYHNKHLWVFSMGVFKLEIGDDQRIWEPRFKFPLEDFLAHNLPWSIMQPVWQTKFITELGGFDVNFFRLQDVELHTRACLVNGIDIHLQVDKPDCFYRIDEERLNFDYTKFISRWIQGALMYCEKFAGLVTVKQKRLLRLTLMAACLPLVLGFRDGKIDSLHYKRNRLELQLGLRKLDGSISLLLIFRLFVFYNQYLPRIPGVNFILRKLIVAL